MKTLAALLALASFGQVGMAYGLEPCAKDIKSYCGKVSVGQGRILNCLKSNSAKLSPDCLGEIARTDRDRDDWWNKCHFDADLHCPLEKLSRSQTFECVMANSTKLSADCRKATEKYLGAR